MEKSLPGLKETSKKKVVTQHKEEGASRIAADGKDRENLPNFLALYVNPFFAANHPPKIVNRHTG